MALIRAEVQTISKITRSGLKKSRDRRLWRRKVGEGEGAPLDKAGKGSGVLPAAGKGIFRLWGGDIAYFLPQNPPLPKRRETRMGPAEG